MAAWGGERCSSLLNMLQTHGQKMGWLNVYVVCSGPTKVAPQGLASRTVTVI